MSFSIRGARSAKTASATGAPGSIRAVMPPSLVVPRAPTATLQQVPIEQR
jgi:hypothetical protein